MRGDAVEESNLKLPHLLSLRLLQVHLSSAICEKRRLSYSQMLSRERARKGVGYIFVLYFLPPPPPFIFLSTQNEKNFCAQKGMKRKKAFFVPFYTFADKWKVGKLYNWSSLIVQRQLPSFKYNVKFTLPETHLPLEGEKLLSAFYLFIVLAHTQLDVSKAVCILGLMINYQKKRKEKLHLRKLNWETWQSSARRINLL